MRPFCGGPQTIKKTGHYYVYFCYSTLLIDANECSLFNEVLKKLTAKQKFQGCSQPPSPGIFGMGITRKV